MSGKKIQVLLVEDSESDTLLIARLLRRAGFDVALTQVLDGDEMRAALLAQPWDVVISDFNLPNFDGMKALAIRQALAPDTPFIVLSGVIGEADAVELLRLGANDCISKNNFPRLVQVIERELEQSQIRKAHIEEQAALHQERLRLKAILEGAVDAIILIDERGTILTFNPAAEKIFAYSAQEIVGKNVSTLMPASEAVVHDSHLQHYVATGEAHIIGKGRELIGQRSNGETFPMDLSISNWHDGKQHYFTGVVRDISERKMLQAQLVHTQKMESLMQLSGGLAHDFNNLLGIIIGNLDLLDVKLSGDEKVRGYLDSALRAALRGADITRRMLSLSRLQPGAARSDQAHDINVLIEEIVALLQRTLGPTYALSTALLPDLPTVRLNPAEFENVILNLALNARDAMPDGGHLTICTRLISRDELLMRGLPGTGESGDYVLIDVSDVGQGMAPDVLAHAMDPFFTTKSGTGTGLGLSMVYGFTKALNGHIKIYSEVGYGTAIHLYLPAGQPGSSHRAATPSQTSELARGDETILVVDDEPDLLALAVEHLTSLGYTTLSAANGVAALALLKQSAHIDLLLTDVVMPGGMLGTELAVHAQQLRPALQVVLCSGFPKKIQDNPRYAQYAKDILSKPFRKSDLAFAVRQKLDASGLNRAIHREQG